MSDSNQTQPTQAQPKQVAPPQEKAKSWTERFLDVEQNINQMIFAINFHGRSIKSMLGQMDNMANELDNLNMVKKSVNAMLKLSEEGKAISTESVVTKIVEIEQEQTKARLKADVEAGRLIATDTVTAGDELVEFNSASEGYGLIGLSKSTDEVKQSFLNKKVGDVVGQMTIIGLYREDAPKAEASPEELIPQ